jgi:hypothetical protein
MQCRLVMSLFLFMIHFQEPQPQQPPNQETKPQEAPYVERSQRQFNFYPGGKIEILAGVPGNVKVVGWKRGSVLVDMERVVHGVTPDQAKLVAEQFPLQVRWTPTSGTIRTAGPPAGTINMEINLTLYVPKEKTDLSIQMPKGDLALGAINGWIEATLLEGSIEAKSVSGYFSATTKSGDVNVELAGTRWEGYGFTAVTRGGTIDLRLPVEYSAALRLETRNGNFTIDYPEQLVDGQSVPLQAVVKKNARSLAATLGSGGSPLRLLTMSGDIRLSKSQAP